MRVPTFNSSQAAFSGIEARQVEQAKLQTQLTTGMRVNSPGDDPVAAAQAEMARSRLARVAQEQRSGQLATSLMAAADGALAQGVDLLQSVREALVAAGDGGYSDADRISLAKQLRSAREGMLALANTRDGAGGFIFSGRGSTDEPVSLGASPAYAAQAGVQRIGSDGKFAATIDGRASFMALAQGNGVFVTASNAGNTGSGWIEPGSVADPTQLIGSNYEITIAGTPGNLTYTVLDTSSGNPVVAAPGLPYQDGATISFDGQNVKVAGTPAVGDSFLVGPAGQQSIFQTLDEAIAVLETPSAKTVYSEKLTRVQASLDRGLDALILMRSQVGDELRNVENVSALGQQEDLLSSQRRSELVELDFAKGISDMQANQIGLEAALKSYATVSKASLFQML
ncbi:flagellar hook-associated protein FlgL [uncultured Ramlibacter sp.]|uniref:flagellar hook-associated protein FlgL n=1 Tax=uncultured Ramlibacter sp. TaxID=260755 RepID=UPI002618641D|nr:flagellar hook-associated protein FlgL [uncultured Ramlibacter sp.]